MSAGLGAGATSLWIEELADVAEAGAKVGEFANYREFVLVVRQMERTRRLVGKFERIAGVRSKTSRLALAIW